MELKLKMGAISVTGKEGIKFCREAFDRVVDLPDAAIAVFLVFDKKLTSDGYRIMRPVKTDVWGVGGMAAQQQSNLAGIHGNYLMHNTKRRLAKAYDAGYRGVHIEYELN